MAGNFTATRPYIYITGNLIDPAQNNANEGTIYTQHNGAFNAVTGHEHTGAIGDGPPLGPGSLNLAGNYAWTGNHSFSAPGTFTLNNGGTFNGTIVGNPNFSGAPTFTNNIVFNSGTAFSGTLNHTNTANRVWTFPDRDGEVVLSGSGNTGPLPPIGTIFPFYDFNALVTFDVNHYRYCDGSVLVYASSPLNGQTLPDLSGRYLIGFGTVGGGNIGTDPWATAAVGNAGWTISIAHTHDMANHIHSISSDSHNHYDNAGGVGFTHHIADTDNPYQTFYSYICHEDTAGAFGDYSLQANAVPSTNEGQHDHYIDNYTHSHTGNTGVPSVNTTSSNLSAAQEIRPSSIRVRYIMRVL